MSKSNILPVFYTVQCTGIAATADQDVFSIVAPADAKIIIPKIVVGQSSDAGDAEAEMGDISIIRGYTTVGSGGAAVTPESLDPDADAAGFTARRNDTTIASSGSPDILWTESFNWQAGFIWAQPVNWDNPELGQIVVGPSVRCVIRLLGDPADAVTLNASALIAELR